MKENENNVNNVNEDNISPRKRGRPKKDVSQSSNVKDDSVKTPKKRGRPKKDTSESSNVKVERKVNSEKATSDEKEVLDNNDELVVDDSKKTSDNLKEEIKDLVTDKDQNINNDRLFKCIHESEVTENKILLANGNNYTTVKERIRIIRKFFGFDLKIITSIKDISNNHAHIEALLYIRDGDSWELIQNANAYEDKNSSMINKTSFVENAETSAIGRVLGFIGVFGNEMVSAEQLENSLNSLSSGNKGKDKVEGIVRKVSSRETKNFDNISEDNLNKINNILKVDKNMHLSMIINGKKDSSGKKATKIEDLSNSDAINIISLYEESRESINKDNDVL